MFHGTLLDMWVEAREQETAEWVAHEALVQEALKSESSSNPRSRRWTQLPLLSLLRRGA
jgi:hypothetical protein